MLILEEEVRLLSRHYFLPVQVEQIEEVTDPDQVFVVVSVHKDVVSLEAELVDVLVFDQPNMLWRRMDAEMDLN